MFRVPLFVAVLAAAACGRLDPTLSPSTTSPPPAQQPGEVSSRPAEQNATLALPPPLPQAPNASWSAPVPVHALTGSSEAPQLISLGGGRTLAVWTQSLSTAPYRRLYSAVLQDGRWSAPLPVSANGPGSEVSLSSAQDGTAVAAWLEYLGNSTRQLVVQTFASGAWSSPTVLSSLTWQQGSLHQPVVRTGADGLAVVAWAARAPTADSYTLFAAARPRGGSWSAGTAIAGAFALGRNSESGSQLDLAVDGKGAVLVAWTRVESAAVEVWARRGQALAGSVGPIAWGAESRVASEVRSPTASAPVYGLWAGFHAGRFFTGWLRNTATGEYALVTRHDRPDGSWDTEAEAAGIRWSNYAAPRFAAAANGDKVLVWREADAEASRIVARWFDGAAGWSPRTVLADGLAPPYLGCIDIDAHFHDVAIDAEGNALAVWEERTPAAGTARGTMHVRASRFLRGAGWSAPAQLDQSVDRASRPVASIGGPNAAVSLFSAEATGGAAPLQSAQLQPRDE